MVSSVQCSGDEKELFGGARLLRLGGHFPGSAVLHWSAGAGGKGVLCTGQTLATTFLGHWHGMAWHGMRCIQQADPLVQVLTSETQRCMGYCGRNTLVYVSKGLLSKGLSGS